MKKLVLSLGLGLALTSAAFAANNTLEQLNSRIVTFLAPFQNETTGAQLAFSTLETNAHRIIKVAVNSFYHKIGSQNTLDLKIDNLGYDYGDGSTPTTTFKGSIGIDFTKLLSQEHTNLMIPLAAYMVEDIVKSNSRQFGDALSIRGVVTSTTKDTDGNYTGLTALFAAKLDLTKLPEYIKSEEILAKEVVFSLTINLKTGVMIDAYMVSNPAYLGFNEDQQGLKELLDKLLVGDERALGEIRGFVTELERMASTVVEMSDALSYFAHFIH